MNKKYMAIMLAILAAALYAINIPLSKLLLNIIEPTMMALHILIYWSMSTSIIIIFNEKNHSHKHVEVI